MSQLSARFDLPAGVHAPAAARTTVASVLHGWGFQDSDWLARAQLVVGELVNNAVRHGGGCLSLDVQAHDGRVFVGAADGSSVVPRTRKPDDRGGRGLVLIEAFTSRWGVHDHEGGKRVWVELFPHP